MTTKNDAQDNTEGAHRTHNVDPAAEKRVADEIERVVLAGMEAPRTFNAEHYARCVARLLVGMGLLDAMVETPAAEEIALVVREGMEKPESFDAAHHARICAGKMAKGWLVTKRGHRPTAPQAESRRDNKGFAEKLRLTMDTAYHPTASQPAAGRDDLVERLREEVALKEDLLVQMTEERNILRKCVEEQERTIADQQRMLAESAKGTGESHTADSADLRKIVEDAFDAGAAALGHSFTRFAPMPDPTPFVNRLLAVRAGAATRKGTT